MTKIMLKKSMPLDCLVFRGPSLHKHNKLAYNSEYRKELWSHLIEELGLDL